MDSPMRPIRTQTPTARSGIHKKPLLLFGFTLLGGVGEVKGRLPLISLLVRVTWATSSGREAIGPTSSCSSQRISLNLTTRVRKGLLSTQWVRCPSLLENTLRHLLWQWFHLAWEAYQDPYFRLRIKQLHLRLRGPGVHPQADCRYCRGTGMSGMDPFPTLLPVWKRAQTSL